MYFRKKYKTAKENRKRMNIQDPVILFPLMFLIASISMILTAIFYVIDPKRHYLGGSFEVSLLTTIFTTSFFEGLTGFLTVVVRFFYSYAEMLPAEASSRTKRNMIFLKRASPFYAFVSLATGILPICMYRYPNQVQQISSAFYFLLFLFAGSGSLLLHATALNPIIREIEKHTKELKQYNQDGDGKLESVVYKMKLARFSLLSSSPPVFIMYILLALIPYLQRNTCYVLPFLFMTGASISFFTTLTLMNYVKPSSYKGSSVKTANGSGVKAAAESSSHAPVADARIAAYTSSSG